MMIGFFKCWSCGKLETSSKEYSHKFCRDCYKEHEAEMNRVWLFKAEKAVDAAWEKANG